MINAAQDVERRRSKILEMFTFCSMTRRQIFCHQPIRQSSAGILIKDLLGGESRHRSALSQRTQERQEKFKKGPEELGITGIPTHFIDLDKMINGLGTSNLMILAARPAMGKTALALNIAENVAFKNSIPVGIFSLEMTAEQLLHRMICSQSEVESDKIRTGSLNGIEYQRIVAAVKSMMKGTRRHR